MRFLWLFFLALPLAAQVSNPSIISVTSAPSGSCTSGLPNQQVLSTGTQYSCQSGTWAVIAGTGGGAALPFPGIVYATSASAGTVATGAQVAATINPSSTQGGPATFSNTTGGFSSSSAYLDCSQFAGADDSLKIQACFAALKTLNSQSGVADARGLTGNVWSVNPFAAANIPNSGTLLLPSGNITVSVPIVAADNWSMVGTAYNASSGTNPTGTVFAAGTALVASASFPATYSTGTITPGYTGSTPAGGTQGYHMTITGSGTSWASTYVGCAFVAPAGGLQPNSTVGIISAVSSTTSLTLGSGMNGGLAGFASASAGSTYDIYCPVYAAGMGGVEAQKGYEYGMALLNVALDANNVAGVVPYMNWYGGQGTYAQNVTAVNYNSFGFDIEGNYTEESGPYIALQSYPGTSSTANTVPFMIAFNGGNFGFYGLTARKGPGPTFPAAGIVVEGSNIVGENWDTEGFATGIAINKTITCSPACLFPAAWAWGPATDVRLNGTTGSGTTAIHVYQYNGNPDNISIRDVNSTVYTNLLIDDANALTVPASPEANLGDYVLDAKGNIGFTTVRSALSTTKSGTAGTAACYLTPQGSLKTVSCYLNAYQETGTAQTWTFPIAFSTTPVLQESGGSCGTYNPTVSSTVLTLPANAAMTAETCSIVVTGQ